MSKKQSSAPTIRSSAAEYLTFIAATGELAKAHAESEFEKFRIVQDRLYESDFDREVKKRLQNKEAK